MSGDQGLPLSDARARCTRCTFPVGTWVSPSRVFLRILRVSWLTKAVFPKFQVTSLEKNQQPSKKERCPGICAVKSRSQGRHVVHILDQPQCTSLRNSVQRWELYKGDCSIF